MDGRIRAAMQWHSRIPRFVLAATVSSSLAIALSAQAQQAESALDKLGRSWDQAYLKPEFNLEPNAFLVDFARSLPAGDALDVGMGQGRNAIFLASQGWNVTGFDVSQVGVTQARESAEKRRLRLTAIRQTAEAFEWGTSRWDLVAVLYFPGLRTYVPRIVASLKPGGVVVVEAYHADAALDRPPGPGAGVTFATNELLTLFEGLRILRYEDLRARADWGMFDTRLVRLVAQRPADSIDRLETTRK
jgi:SAM-dependent methyltransferase